MKKIIVILMIGFSVGCAGGGGSGNAVVAEKSLFAIWVRNDLLVTIDLSSGSLGTFAMQWTLSAGHKCNSNITMTGTTDSGNYSVSSSTYVNGTGNGVDPGCNTLNQTGTFSKSGNVLTICTNGTSCGSYN